jgi:hypothetical protein
MEIPEVVHTDPEQSAFHTIANIHHSDENHSSKSTLIKAHTFIAAVTKAPSVGCPRNVPLVITELLQTYPTYEK